MIEELTAEQEAKMPEYVEKYTAIGLATDRIDRDKAYVDVNKFRRSVLDAEGDVPIEVYDNPKLAWEAVCTHEGEKVDFIWPYLDGNFYASFFAFYDFMIQELGIVLDKDLMKKYEDYHALLSYSLIYPLDNVCVLSEKPLEIHMENGKLHCEDGPAIVYEGDFVVYALGGVRMHGCEFLFDGSVTAEKVMAITNVEQRLQAIKLFGLGKLLDKLNYEVIDSKDEYELILLELEGRKCEYLKMANPTNGEIHVEGVPPKTKTVTEAMAWRTGLSLYKEPLVKA